MKTVKTISRISQQISQSRCRKSGLVVMELNILSYRKKGDT